MSNPSSSHYLSVESLAFTYESASIPLFENLQFSVQSGWTGVCGANGAGKSTLLQLIAGKLLPAEGKVRSSGAVVLCEQRTDVAPVRAWEFIEDYSASSYQIRVGLGIEDEWIERWDTLSHGERKRLQIGTALWQEPAVLLLDEPSNHLDCESVEKVSQTLRAFAGVGLIVTHDRQLLDELCQQCIWFSSKRAPVLMSGGYTLGKESMAREQLEKGRALERLEKAHKRLNRTASDYRREACQADRKRSNRGIDPGDNDARGKRNLARVSGKGAVAQIIEF